MQLSISDGKWRASIVTCIIKKLLFVPQPEDSTPRRSSFHSVPFSFIYGWWISNSMSVHTWGAKGASQNDKANHSRSGSPKVMAQLWVPKQNFCLKKKKIIFVFRQGGNKAWVTGRGQSCGMEESKPGQSKDTAVLSLDVTNNNFFSIG